MIDLVTEIFSNYSKLIIMLHVLCSMILLGGLIVFSITVLPLLNAIKDEEEKFSKLFKIISSYRYFVLIIMVVIFVTSMFMSVGLGFEFGDPMNKVLIQTKRALWIFMFFNFAYMEYKFKCAKKEFLESNYIEVEENMILIIKYFIPLNIILIIIATYFGVELRGY